MTRTNKTARTLSDSPLLNNDAESSVLHSTIHPERLDMSRFSDRMIEEDEEGSPLRIIIYVIVVIAIGVGLALGVRYLISQNNQTASPDNTTNQPTTNGNQPIANGSLVKVNTTAVADSTATNAPEDSDFAELETTIVGTGLSLGSQAALQEISYQKYNSFTRTTFTFEGLGNNNELPSAIIGFQPNNNRMTIDFDANLNMPAAGINPTNNVNDLLRDITASLPEKQFTLQFARPIEHHVAIVGNTLIIDAREKGATTPTTNGTGDTTAGETPTEPVTTGSETPGTNTSGGTTTGTPTTNGGGTGTTTGGTTTTPQPTGNNYTNEFSQTVQNISNTRITGNTISYNEVYYEDQGQYFEFALGERLKVGNAYIPNAKAEYTTISGKDYIRLTIQNVAGIQFEQITATELTASTGISLENANFVSAKRESFTNGTVVILFEVKRKADFRLVSEPTVSGLTQVIALQIRD